MTFQCDQGRSSFGSPKTLAVGSTENRTGFEHSEGKPLAFNAPLTDGPARSQGKGSEFVVSRQSSRQRHREAIEPKWMYPNILADMWKRRAWSRVQRAAKP